MDGPLGEAVRKRRGGAAAERGAEGDVLREALAASGVLQLWTQGQIHTDGHRQLGTGVQKTVDVR